ALLAQLKENPDDSEARKRLDRIESKGVRVEKPKQAGDKEAKSVDLFKVYVMEASGKLAVLAGNVIIIDISSAPKVLGTEKGWVSRIDLVLEPGSNVNKVQAEVRRLLQDSSGREQASVRTPDEQNRAVGNVMSGMQAGFSLCGWTALVVGLFLVYNSLAVTVAGRRHEIGVLLSVGATRPPIPWLFRRRAGF